MTRLNQYISVSILLTLLTIITACFQATPNPKPPLSSKIYLEKGGYKTGFDYWVNHKDSHPKNVLMLGIELTDPNRIIDIDYIRRLDVALKVKVTKINEPSKKNNFGYYPFKIGKDKSDRENAENEAITHTLFNGSMEGGVMMFVIATLDRVNYGKYRVEVEVINDNPDLLKKDFSLFLDYRSLGGK
jgi:hypothetical protein